MILSGTLKQSSIEIDQLDKLNKLLTALVPNNRFYTKKLQQADFGSGVSSLAEFSEQMPFTSKQEVIEDQTAFPPFGSNLTFPMDRYVRFSQTSGTTQHPMRWLDTAESWNWMLENWTQVYRAAGVGSGDRIYFAFSFGPFLGFWTAFESATRLGCLCIPGGGLSSIARLRSMIENKVQVLCCTPTYALRLAEVAMEEHIDLQSLQLKTIIVAGEPGGSIPATRAKIKQLWNGARVFDHHGMTEVGPVSFECPEQPGTLSIIESSYFAEVIDPHDGKPVSDGQAGELILTTLGRTGSPLLRYRTGDLVKKRCIKSKATGYLHLMLEGGILGRTDDMLIIRGVNIYPGSVEEIVRSCNEVAEYRVEIHENHSMLELNLVVEPVPGCQDPENLVKKLETAFQSTFLLQVHVSVVKTGILPRFEMKAKRWVKVMKKTPDS